MELLRIGESLRKCSDESELIFAKIGSSFPALLSVNKTSEESSLNTLKLLLKSISDGFAGYRQDEVVFFECYNAENSALFTALNEKMGALSGISAQVSAIRSDSEELEIIALNAMIVSIKSGDKGRAFSCITENLKKLSAQMIDLSNLLILDQKKLLVKNDALNEAFSALDSTQKILVGTRETATESQLPSIILSATASLETLQTTALAISKPILDAMGGIQLQDIIRQSIDQILLALSEVKAESGDRTREETLDLITFNSELLSISSRIARDVTRNLESSIQTFSSNWKKVHAILDEVELLREKFKADYLDDRDGNNASIPAHLERMTGGFSLYIGRISQYQRVKRVMVRDSSLIVTEVKHLRILFDSITPIIGRLQHVRINQQIEVAKNEALASVIETVKYMSSLINQADVRVQETRKVLVRFIGEIEELISVFTSGSGTENREIEQIKKDKTEFFGKMKEFQESLSSLVVRLQVYPDSFQQLCLEIDARLAGLDAIRSSVSDISLECDRHLAVFQSKRDKLLSEAGLSEWVIANTDFKRLVERFTITSHKEAAGEIGGFEVEKFSADAVETGDSPMSADSLESGDVTLFF